LLLLATVVVVTTSAQQQWLPDIPKTWDEGALKDWATPLASLNVRPTHITAAQYYSLPIDNLRTYPVYAEGREPAGYWEFLQRVGPQPLIEPEKLKTEADWLEAGRIVFEQSDHIHLRTNDPKFIAMARRGLGRIESDGTVGAMRWVPTKEGVALTFTNCGACHRLPLQDGGQVPGAPSFGGARAGAILRARPPGPSVINQVQLERRFLDGGSPIRMGPEPFGMWLYRAFGMPWESDDVNAGLKTMTEPEFRSWFTAGQRGGALPRWNGSLYFPAKIPDLIGIKDRKYIDHTATHLNRGIGDLMRYAGLVSWAESTEFGGHEMLGGGAEMPKARRSDEALYALALYIQSLQPPRNPNPHDDNAKAGEKLFHREGCVGCHVPPLYTSNKLTLAQGFTPPKDLPKTLDVLPVSVGTDPGLALHTRKGTGFYKVPSLKGVWYRGHYLHDGSVASLEEMFDPDRLKDTHTPGGFTPPDKPRRAIKGHEFGLKLEPEERKQLIAFLRTL
jgi:mono/diheme cytochrome c family protein